MTQEVKALIYLTLITVLWGLTFPLIKNALTAIAPATFVTVRFGLASLILLPFIIRDFKQSSVRPLVAGVILGTLNGLAYLLQTVGLQTISAAQAAFIIGITVIFVPLITPWLRLGKPHKIDFIAALLSILGLYIFTGFALQIRIGSLWCLLSTVSSALSIVFLQFITKKNPTSLSLLAFYQVLFTIPIPAVISTGDAAQNLAAPAVLAALLFCAIFATSIAFMVQTKFQHFVNPTTATLIYGLEPVFAMFFAWPINHAPITCLMLIGGTIMLLGTFLHAATNHHLRLHS